MTDNELLARWQGLENVRSTRLSNGATVTIYSHKTIPDYPNDAAACDSLLDTLVEKGYDPDLYYGWDTGVGSWYFQAHIGKGYHVKPTRREAIVTAVLELIEK